MLRETPRAKSQSSCFQFINVKFKKKKPEYLALKVSPEKTLTGKRTLQYVLALAAEQTTKPLEKCCLDR